MCFAKWTEAVEMAAGKYITIQVNVNKRLDIIKKIKSLARRSEVTCLRKASDNVTCQDSVSLYRGYKFALRRTKRLWFAKMTLQHTNVSSEAVNLQHT